MSGSNSSWDRPSTLALGLVLLVIAVALVGVGVTVPAAGPSAEADTGHHFDEQSATVPVADFIDGTTTDHTAASTDATSGQSVAVLADSTTPSIANFSASNPDSQNVTVAFESNETLATIDVTISGVENASLTESDFSASSSDGVYLYATTYEGSLDGNYTATLDTAADDAGNDGADNQSDTVTVDTRAPLISNFTASNPESQNVSVSFESDEQLSTIGVTISGIENATLSEANFSEAYNGGSYAYNGIYEGSLDGDYMATLDTAADDAGNDGANGESANVTVDSDSDTTAPLISNFTASNPESQNVSVSFESDEQLSTIGVTISGIENATLSTGDFDEFTGNSTYQYYTVYEGSLDGDYMATLDTATDNAGNDGANGETANVTVDTRAPLISNFTASNPSGQNVAVSFSSDEQLNTIDVIISGVENATLSESNFTETYNDGAYDYDSIYEGSLDGDYMATLGTATDDAGNDGANGESANVTVDSSTTTGTLNGTVVNAETGDPIGGATVSVIQNRTVVTSSNTTSDGSYKLTLDTGDYGISVDADGYTSATTSGVTISENNTTTESFGLSPESDDGSGGAAGYLNGTVIDGDSGDAISGVTVEAFNFQNKDGAVATTDANGSYSLSLAPGNYTINVQASGYGDQYIQNVPVVENETTEENVSLVQGGTITGTVTDENGDTLGGASVMIEGDQQYFASANQTGYYAVDVEPGNYTVSAFTQQGRIANRSYTVSVNQTETTTQDLSMITAGIQDLSVSYLGGSGSPDMANISANANLQFGLVQVQLLDDTNQQGPGMPQDLEGLGVAPDDRFRISFNTSGYDPAALLWGAKNVTWSSTDNGDGTYSVTVDTETVTLQGINDQSLPVGPLQGTSPEEIAWPGGANDTADLGWNRTVYFGLYDMSNVPSERLGQLEGISVATNAQTFSRPRLVETTTEDGDTREELQVYVGGPNKTVEGNSHNGFYEAFIPDGVLSEWGVSEPETELEALYKGSDQAVTVNETQDGAELELDIGYSDGTVQVGANTTADTTAPSISNYSVSNPSGQNVSVSFDSDEQLATINVSISGAEDALLTESNFTETDNGGNYTYGATYSGSTDGNYTATLDTAADDAGNDGADTESGTVTVDTAVPDAIIADDQTIEAGQNGTVTVTVEEESGTGIADETVTVVDTGSLSGLNDSAVTNESGTATLQFDEDTAGKYIVQVAVQNHSDVNTSTTVTVEPGPVDSVVLDPAGNRTIEFGERVDFDATAYDTFDNVVEDNDANFQWTNADKDGTFVGDSLGTQSVIATTESVDSASVTVTVAPVSGQASYRVDSIDVPDSVPAGEPTTLNVTVQNVGDQSDTQDIEVLTGSVAASYADRSGAVETDGLRGAVRDWQSAELGTDRLLTVIDSWTSGSAVDMASIETAEMALESGQSTTVEINGTLAEQGEEVITVVVRTDNEQSTTLVNVDGTTSLQSAMISIDR